MGNELFFQKNPSPPPPEYQMVCPLALHKVKPNAYYRLIKFQGIKPNFYKLVTF